MHNIIKAIYRRQQAEVAEAVIAEVEKISQDLLALYVDQQ